MDIKEAYINKARKYHPDSPNGDEAIFKALSEAYQTLSNAEQKHIYDMKIGNRQADNVYEDLGQEEVEDEDDPYAGETPKQKEKRLEDMRELSMRKKEQRERLRMLQFINMQLQKNPRQKDEIDLKIEEANKKIYQQVLEEHLAYKKYGKDWVKMTRKPESQIKEDKENELKLL